MMLFVMPFQYFYQSIRDGQSYQECFELINTIELIVDIDLSSLNIILYSLFIFHELKDLQHSPDVIKMNRAVFEN